MPKKNSEIIITYIKHWWKWHYAAEDVLPYNCFSSFLTQNKTRFPAFM